MGVAQKTEKRIAVLDAWRGIACILVLFYHCGANLSFGGVALQGYVGVHIFFVLSGFLLYTPFARSRWNETEAPDVSKYLARRFLRIYPPYCVCLLLFVLMRVFAKTNSGVPTTENIVAHLGLYFNYGEESWFLSINNVFWTLAIEVQFYLLLPVAVFSMSYCFKGKRLAVWSVPFSLLVLGVVSRFVEFTWLTTSSNDFRFRSVFSYLDLFACGMVLACPSGTVPETGRLKRHFLSFAVGVLCMILSVSWSHALGGWQSSDSLICVLLSPLLCAIGAAMIIGSSLRIPSRVHDNVIFRFLTWVGTISYSVYLYHTGVQFFVFKLQLHPPGGWVVMAFTYALISLPIGLGVAWLMFTLVEKPCVNLLAKRKLG